MSTATRLAAFAAALLAVFAGGWALGDAVGPFGETTPAPHTEHVR